MYLFYVVPMSLIPSAMLLYALSTYGGVLSDRISTDKALVLAAGFYILELVVVPVMARVVQRIGEVADARPDYRDAFVFAAVIPTPLWLASLFLFAPSLTVAGLAMALGLFGSGLLIYEGAFRIFQVEDEGHSILLAGSVLAAGLVAWVAMMVLAFVSWSWVMS
jgi:hypothetical protein